MEVFSGLHIDLSLSFYNLRKVTIHEKILVYVSGVSLCSLLGGSGYLWPLCMLVPSDLDLIGIQVAWLILLLIN